MPKMLSVQSGDETIYVNPSLIRMLRPGGEKHTVIDLAHDHMRQVDLPIVELARLLDLALNTDH